MFAFRCAGVTEVTIPGSVNIFDTSAFRDSKTLKNINLESGIKKTIGAILANYDEIEELIIPSTITELNIFGGCGNLTKVTFENNSQLEVIGDGCFSSCVSLHQINIPESVKKIGEYAFIRTQIQRLSFPNVESIGDHAFNKVEFIQIGHKVKSIGNYALQGCQIVELGTENLTNCNSNLFGDASTLRELRLSGKTLMAEIIIRNIIKNQKNLFDSEQNDLSNRNYTKIIYCDSGVCKNILKESQEVLQELATNPNFKIQILPLQSNAQQASEDNEDSQSKQCLIS